MAQRFTHYDIVVSCPSDMNNERLTVQSAVQIFNEQNAQYHNLYFEVKYWSKDVLFTPGDPQLVINKSIIRNADLIIALFGAKLGTPTERAASGTIEEMEEMIKAGKQVFVCFSEKDILIKGDDSYEQIQNLLKVKEFQKNYKGLYITYKTEQELINKLTNQLRLYLNALGTYDEPYICNVPFTFQELRGNRRGLDSAQKLIFIARTGKIFLGKHYNHIVKMVENGGIFIYVTSENFNTVGDTSEYQDNQNYALTVLKRLHKRFPKNVEIHFLSTPVNCTMYYMKELDGCEIINVKFNFQTYHYNDNHPMFDLYTENPLFNIFYQEINGILNLTTPLNLD